MQHTGSGSTAGWILSQIFTTQWTIDGCSFLRTWTPGAAPVTAVSSLRQGRQMTALGGEERDLPVPLLDRRIRFALTVAGRVADHSSRPVFTSNVDETIVHGPNEEGRPHDPR
jgi:hypothetical protein